MIIPGGRGEGGGGDSRTNYLWSICLKNYEHVFLCVCVKSISQSC